MTDLKILLGEKFKEDMTDSDIVEAIKGSDKIVNLKSGEYISAEKFNNVEKKYKETDAALQDALQNTGSIDELKTKNETYEKTIAGYKSESYLRENGFKDIEYGKYLIAQGKISLEDNKTIQSYLKENPNYDANFKEPEPPEPPKVIVGNLNKEDGTATDGPKQPWMN